MLLELHIQNLAIFDEVRQTLGEGLNVVTGETGAGKSLLAGALGLLVGEKAAADQIRSGEDVLTVEALFDVSDLPATRALLEKVGVEPTDEVVLRRVVRRGSRGSAAINGSLVPVAHLTRVAESLVSIVGQHSHQRLLKPAHHLEILDRVAGTADDVEALVAERREWKRVRAELVDLRDSEGGAADRLAVIGHQIAEIERLSPREGEDVELGERREVLRHAEELDRAAALGTQQLYEGEPSAVDLVEQARSELERAGQHDPALAEIAEGLTPVRVALDEAALKLADYRARLTTDPQELETVEERLDALERLKRRHEGDLSHVLSRLEQLHGERDGLADAPQRVRELEEAAGASAARLVEIADRLTKARRKAARKLEKAVAGELADLGMPKARLLVALEPVPPTEEAPCGPRGSDDVRFLMAANPGEDPRPLDRVASGGELSRTLLALTRVAGGGVQTPVVLFDEVDSGVGGGVAEGIGRKLAEIARDHQVLCITHLPQTASFGHVHLTVSKRSKGGRTAARVSEVRGPDRVQEIARMLGGEAATATAVAHAEEMLSR